MGQAVRRALDERILKDIPGQSFGIYDGIPLAQHIPALRKHPEEQIDVSSIRIPLFVQQGSGFFPFFGALQLQQALYLNENYHIDHLASTHSGRGWADSLSCRTAQLATTANVAGLSSQT